MKTLKSLAIEIENKSNAIEKYEKFLMNNPTSCIFEEIEESIKRLKSEKIELQRKFDLL